MAHWHSGDWATWQISVNSFPDIQQNPKEPQVSSAHPQGSLHIFTAFDILGGRPRGTRNDFSWRWAVATNRMIHSGFQLAPYGVLRKCPSGAGSVWRNCPEIPDAIIWNTYYLHRKPWQIFFFLRRDTSSCWTGKSCFSKFSSVPEIPRENTRIRQLYVTDLVSSFHLVALFFFP